MKNKLSFRRHSFLAFCLILGGSLFLKNCDSSRNGGPAITHFVYKNVSNYTVKMILMNAQSAETHTIPPNESFQITRQENKEHSGDTGILTPFTSEYDEVNLQFVEINKCLVNFPKLRTVKLYDNFTEEMYKYDENTLIYLIDAEEVDAAQVCN